MRMRDHFLILCATMPILAVSPTLIQFRQAGMTIDSTYLATKETLTTENAKVFAQSIAKQHLGKFTFLKVSIFSNEIDALDYQGKSSECSTYADCIELSRKAKSPSGPIVEVLVTEAGTALRGRSRNGEIHKEVYAGRDPYTIRANGAVFEIVHLHVTERAPLLSIRSANSSRVEVFLISSETITEEICGRATAILARSIGHNLVSARYRRDNDFWYSSGFPARQPFIQEHRTPSMHEMSESKTIACSLEQSEVSCLTLP